MRAYAPRCNPREVRMNRRRFATSLLALGVGMPVLRAHAGQSILEQVLGLPKGSAPSTSAAKIGRAHV